MAMPRPLARGDLETLSRGGGPIERGGAPRSRGRPIRTRARRADRLPHRPHASGAHQLARAIRRTRTAQRPVKMREVRRPPIATPLAPVPLEHLRDLAEPILARIPVLRPMNDVDREAVPVPTIEIAHRVR